jgi:aspartokinase
VSSSPAKVQETAFEKQRGISQVEVRGGFAQVHVSRLTEPVHENRLHVLKAIAEAGVSVDFLKLTPSGVSFVITENATSEIESALGQFQAKLTIRKDRSVVMVHAVNMRDEEGLTANVVQEAISSGVVIDHISDMHDRMLMVVESKFAPTIEDLFKGVANGR